ncbi:MAG TPA: PRC-barrel domain-containing protein, partial [Pirellulales bacterium]|nr:PRC-barrel domain-containing protein [Pirellulales bacterium]
MTPFRCLAILVCALLVNFGQAWTPTQPAKAAEAPADAADRIKAALPKDKIDEPEVGPVARATTFLDLEISDGKGAKIGQVEDLALDLQENFVAFFVVDLDDLLGGKRVALPLGTVRLTAGAKHLTT